MGRTDCAMKPTMFRHKPASQTNIKDLVDAGEANGFIMEVITLEVGSHTRFPEPPAVHGPHPNSGQNYS